MVSTIDYTSVTEAAGTAISAQALDMLWTRYAFASRLCGGRDVLEVACGSGLGLGQLAATARRVVGGDYTHGLLTNARREYGDALPLLRFDAQVLPFRDRCFDVVVIFEALYYLADADAFLSETRRVLRSGGTLVLCSANPEWRDFNPSPYSRRYWKASELRALLDRHGFSAELFGAFRADPTSARDQLVSLLKRAAVSSGLMPKTMKGKRLLKRMFLGPLTPVPGRVVEGVAAYQAPVPLDSSEANAFKVLYAVAHHASAP